MENWSLRLFGGFGVVLFLPLFLITFADPHSIEAAAKHFIASELKSQTDDKIDAIRLPEVSSFEARLGKRAEELRLRAERELESVKDQLKADAPRMLSEQLAKLRDLDCTCRQQWENAIRLSLESRKISLEETRRQLVNFTHAKYMEIVQKLTMDVRIFLGSNLLVFLVLLIASFLKPRAAKQLFLPGALLLLSTIICSYFYLFEQNWFYTILYNDYTGFAYIGYLVFVFAFLCDVVFNRARVTTEIINSIFSAIGQAPSLVPC